MQPASPDSHSSSGRSARAARRGLLLLPWLLLADASLFAGAAAAYCRADVQTDANGECVERPGVPRLHWLRSCSSYAFNEHVFERIPLLDEAQVRAAFASSFEAWRAVDCGRQPFFVQQVQALSVQDGAQFEWDVSNTSVMALHTAGEWADLEYGSEVVALTTLFHDRDTGEIFDVDIELNGGAGSFSNCTARCGVGRIDLRNTITHEAGHYFGLGHSEDSSATMAEYAFDGREIEKATLEGDDRAGYCALELPPHACASGGCTCPAAPKYSRSSRSEDGGCALALPRGGSEPWSWLAIASLISVMLIRRQRS